MAAALARTPEIDARRARAEAGIAEAQFFLGGRYNSGDGVPQDYAEALRWYQLAAEQGFAGGQVGLGLMYGNGWGVPEDDAEAVRWMRLAAEQGFAEGQTYLGTFFFGGLGVPQDYVLAHMWFNLAASRSTDDVREPAVRNRDIVAGRMTAEQVAEAQRLARDWDAAHPRDP